ncbi:hypothetical protein [Polaribacter sp. Hel1_85]|uniref:hypothetical protein n=1 Tax=Polaribacter sp. Hel1_85 TaxID=1250005 RepID=UPI00052D921D|nr:hypothetical protein [Polaribacter sp. Hel1_85]KGL58522.1 hypothetical protein PHEL85_2786 [Polaribacter sp. Hel1_85]
MKVKWYISTLFLLFICFGAFQEEVTIPNQEIVLEFVDAKINKKNIENTITDVKEKLLKVGVTNIKISETQNGTLKISYHSDFHIDNIKKELAKENELVLNQHSENQPKNKDSSNYNLDIYELTNETDISNSDFKFVFEVKYNSDRFTTYNYFAFLKKIDQHKADQLFKNTYKTNKNNPFIKDHSSHKEPEVRAGPKKHYS